MSIRLKRAYDKPAQNDGRRVLVDRMWPRGVRKDEAAIDQWLKEIAPSSDLRQWFGHDPEKWDEFKRRYFAELDRHKDDLAPLAEQARNGRLTLVFAAKDEARNNAVALKEYLQNHHV